MSKHTPTPWAISAEDPSTILGLKPGKDYTAVIAETKGYKEEREANARLIAAAPDLLAALEGAEYAMQILVAHPGYACGDFSAIRAKARAAIAKAKGE